MTLTDTLRSALAQQVTSTFSFAFDAAKDQWTVTGQVSIDAPDLGISIAKPVQWEFSNRGLTSHLPKLRLEEAMQEWGLAEHPKAKAIYDLIDMQFRNERGKIIDQVFQVYKPGDPTNF